MEEIEEDIKSMIKKIMDYNWLNQKELADKLSVDPSCISRWLNGKSEPRIAEFKRLREEFNKLPKERIQMVEV